MTTKNNGPLVYGDAISLLVRTCWENGDYRTAVNLLPGIDAEVIIDIVDKRADVDGDSSSGYKIVYRNGFDWPERLLKYNFTTNELEEDLSKLLDLHRKQIDAATDAVSCRTDWDYKRFNEVEEEYIDYYNSFLKKWNDVLDSD